MHHEEADVIVELHTHRQRAGLDHGLLGAHGRRRHVGVVVAPHVRTGLESGGRIEIMGDLEVVDVNVDRMLVVVLVDELPLFDRAEPRLDQGHIGKRRAGEGVDEGLGIGLAREVVEESAGDHQVPLEVGGDFGNVHEGGVSVERLSFGEFRRDALAAGGRRFGQDLGRGDEEPVVIADRRRQDAHIAERGRGIVGSVVLIEHPRSVDRRRAAASRRHLQDQVPFGRHRHRDGIAGRRRNEQLRAVLEDGIMDLRIGQPVLADDGDLGVIAGRRLGELRRACRRCR